MSAGDTKNGRKDKHKTSGVLYLRDINPTVKDFFKSTCYRRKEYMADVIEALMRAYIRNPKMVIVKRRKDKKDNRKKPTEMEKLEQEEFLTDPIGT